MDVVRAREEVDLEYIKTVTATVIMMRSMDGDTTADILTYLSIEKVVNTVLTDRTWHRKAREMQNNMEIHDQMSKVRIQNCINKLQETKAVPGCHEDIVIVNKAYKAGAAVQIIEESQEYSCYVT